uniref:Uncharacterized protein n=2 Tax=Strongyloides stercoralis TaxID=6248 RepID=A0A0K0DS59_STRER
SKGIFLKKTGSCYSPGTES